MWPAHVLRKVSTEPVLGQPLRPVINVQFIQLLSK